MTRLLPLVSLLLVALTTFIARAQTPQAPPDVVSVAKHIDQATLVVVRIDLSVVDPAEVFKELAGVIRDSTPDADRRRTSMTQAGADLAAWRKTFTAAGGKYLYIAAQFDLSKNLPMFVIATSETTPPPPALGAALSGLPAPLGEAPFASGTVYLAGPEQVTPRVIDERAPRASELALALSAAGDAPIQIALIPAPFVRRAIEESIPALTAELGGGPSSVVTRGVTRGSAALKLSGTGASVKVVLQSASPADATAFAAFLTDNLTRAQAELDKHSPRREGPGLLELFNPTVESDRITVSIQGDKLTTFKHMLINAAFLARSAASATVSASNIRNILLGCIMYADDHKGEWPQTLDQLVQLEILTPQILIDPASPGAQATYVYLRPRSNPGAAASTFPIRLLVHQRFETWPAAGVWAGFTDGHVQLIRSEAEFKKLVTPPADVPAK